MRENGVVRQLLPETVKNLFDDIVYQRVLGASKHIFMIGQMIEAIAKEGKENGAPIDKVVDDILTVSKFFIETRGEASQAISNAINMMVKDIALVKKMDLEDGIKQIISKKDSYAALAKESLDLVVNYSVKAAESMEKIMVFDYSSTVDQFLKKMKREDRDLTVVIPESRSIDGGHAFVKTCLEVGHKVKFIPDAAIMYFLKECDGAFIGAETFFPDGTVFNTTGSDLVGLVCSEFKIPLYVLTPLIKVDIRPVYGYKKVLVENDLSERLASNWKEEERGNVDFICPELLGVDPKYITAVITEKGIIPARQLFNVSVGYSKELKGDV
ncbi:hypothetical protein D1B31_21105 [Neobacillus notoginsengisoli]|uniref:Translation initiation factor eIF2B subunit beta n=1 Tax=Neobacillus notoginsengisoli TaxID=1578198 RepID=A0A417YIF8_9BACI|nr:hypothetical protein [Neobacillus notoginsengisoli]RHW32846.1 hypothetical protein D1B31_21105 [Neobacillus notoginsengisoli]